MCGEDVSRPEIQKKIRLQSLTYMNGTGHSFITTRAVGDMVCVDNTPAEWWMMHGYETPELRQLEIIVLSQVIVY